jgi:hypothetical protein
MEWVLLITLNLIGQPGEMRDVSTSAVGGFTSRATCEAAAARLAERLVALVGHAREQRGIRGGTMTAAPAINTECVEVRK